MLQNSEPKSISLPKALCDPLLILSFLSAWQHRSVLSVCQNWQQLTLSNYLLLRLNSVPEVSNVTQANSGERQALGVHRRWTVVRRILSGSFAGDCMVSRHNKRAPELTLRSSSGWHWGFASSIQRITDVSASEGGKTRGSISNHQIRKKFGSWTTLFTVCGMNCCPSLKIHRSDVGKQACVWIMNETAIMCADCIVVVTLRPWICGYPDPRCRGFN